MSEAKSRDAWFRSLMAPGDVSVQKRIDELMAQERDTRPARVRLAFEQGAESDFSGRDRQLFDMMWLGREVDDVNAELAEDCRSERADLAEGEADPSRKPKYGLYSLWRTPRLITLYCWFGSKSKHMPGRLSPEAERSLLDLLWERTRHKNDIAVARKSTWWMAGSENHDLNTKACNLVTSLIFAEHPDFRDRVYPNLGYGDGIAYGESSYYGQDGAERHGGGRANWADGREYRPRDHYEAWLQYLNDYFTERAKRGFFLENGSPTYMKYTIGYILMVHNFCGNEALRMRTAMFLDLMWADWAQQQIAGLRGGPKTRHHKTAGGYDSMADLAEFYLGGVGKTSFNYTQQILSDYAWPRIVWELALDREGLGSFAYVSRGIGEEEATCPRPLGTERTMMGDTRSRFVKYCWVTPDYILGTQMDHPHALYNHLATAGRWQGLVTRYPDARLVTVALDPPDGATEGNTAYDMEFVYHGLQHKQVLITQQRRRWTQSNPDWYPAKDAQYDRAFGLYLGPGWDRIEEKDGWILLENGDVYAAVRVVLLEAEDDPKAWAKGTDRFRGRVVLRDDCFAFSADRTIVRLTDRFSPIIIEAGRRADHATLEDFAEMIAHSRLEIYRTVVTRSTGVVVVYRSAADGSEEMVFSAANTSDVPTVGGEHIDFEHPKVFDSPYIQSDYESGVVGIRKGPHRLDLDFNAATRSE